MKKTMKKLLIILLLLISAVSLFAAEGDGTTTNTESSGHDELKVTTTVGTINDCAFVASDYTSATDKSPSANQLENVPDANYSDIAEGNGYGFKAAVRTNVKGTTTLTVTVASPMTGESYKETYPVILSSSNAADSSSQESPVESTDPATSLTLTGKDIANSKLRAFDYTLTLKCPGLINATADTYSTTLKLTASYNG